MAITSKTKKSSSCSRLKVAITVFIIPPFFVYIYTSLSFRQETRWGGDLRSVNFAWNHLPLADNSPPPETLKIAVFSKKWPVGTEPGGMERHAQTLHRALSRRGHRVHVFTSPPPATQTPNPDSYPRIHFHEGKGGRWRYNKAWEDFIAENKSDPFDVVHSESVALPHWIAKTLPNLAVSWHGIALESLQSSIYQDLAFQQTPGSYDGVIPRILQEIRFFHSYANHVAISHSCGDMLRDVYQIPERRVHVILNGVDDQDFAPDYSLGREFRVKIGVDENSSLILGVAGRLVKDKGHPLLHEAFGVIRNKYPAVVLAVAGSGPWEHRYKELGSGVRVLGSMKVEELRGFYNAIDVFVNPTLRPQGLDLTLMEAMMVGKPVMASRFPSIKGSIVVEEEFGFLFAPNVASLVEALETAVVDGREKLAKRGEACRRYASSMFTARKMAMAYERLFLCIKNGSFCLYP